MALLVAGWTESLKSVLNPLVGLDTIRHMGPNYFKAFPMYLAVQFVAFVFTFAVGLRDRALRHARSSATCRGRSSAASSPSTRASSSPASSASPSSNRPTASGSRSTEGAEVKSPRAPDAQRGGRRGPPLSLRAQTYSGLRPSTYSVPSRRLSESSSGSNSRPLHAGRTRRRRKPPAASRSRRRTYAPCPAGTSS